MANKKHGGFTLVEMIVSFMLLSVLLGATMVLLPSFYQQYMHVQSTARLNAIGSTLLETIDGELTYATGKINVVDEDSNYCIVEYENAKGDKIRMSVISDYFKNYVANSENITVDETNNNLEDGLLVLHYEPIIDMSNPDKITRDAVNWGYTLNNYDDCIIKKFNVSKASNEYRKNIIIVSLEMKNVKTGITKQFSRMIECRNFQNIDNNDITING